MQGQIFLISALDLVMDLHKDMLKRMVVFIGGYTYFYHILLINQTYFI